MTNPSQDSPPGLYEKGYYEGYRISRWDTPISTVSYGSYIAVEKMLVTPLHMAEQRGSQTLTIEIKDSYKPGVIAISFHTCIALRIIEEFYFSGGFEGDIRQLGNTLIVDNSPWIAKLKETSPAFDGCAPLDAKHYLILTDDYTIEIISSSTPVIEILD